MAMVASPSPAASAAIPPASPSPPKPQFHVLAVDDSVLDRKLIERLLRTSSYHVTAVESVSKALEFLGMHQQQGGPAAATPSCSSSSASSSSYYFRQQEISLIITDYSMPGMTGYDLLKTVKGSGSPVRDIPVVIMSSENVPARINRCLEEGADEFFLKPVKLSDMSKLRPHILRGKPAAATKDDQEAVTWGNSQSQSRVQQERTQLDMGQEQQLLLTPEQISGDAAAANDSPRSNKRKADQGAADSLEDQRTRTNYPRYDVCI